MSTQSKSNTKSCLRSKNKTWGSSTTAKVQPPRTLYVSLDNADKVIEGGPGFGVKCFIIGTRFGRKSGQEIGDRRK
jgi:hypothetical protein